MLNYISPLDVCFGSLKYRIDAQSTICDPLIMKHRKVQILYIQLYRVIQNYCRSTIFQRQFLIKFGKQPPSDNSIRRWYAQFQEKGCVCIPEPKVRIRTSIETITAYMRNELDYRVDVCRITNGAYIEHM